MTTLSDEQVDGFERMTTFKSTCGRSPSRPAFSASSTGPSSSLPRHALQDQRRALLSPGDWQHGGKEELVLGSLRSPWANNDPRSSRPPSSSRSTRSTCIRLKPKRKRIAAHYSYDFNALMQQYNARCFGSKSTTLDGSDRPMCALHARFRSRSERGGSCRDRAHRRPAAIVGFVLFEIGLSMLVGGAIHRASSKAKRSRERRRRGHDRAHHWDGGVMKLWRAAVIFLVVAAAVLLLWHAPRRTKHSPPGPISAALSSPADADALVRRWLAR